MQWWQQLIESVIGNGIALTIIGWFGRKIISQYLNRNIENYKTKLEFENAVTMEKLKQEIQMKIAEHDIIFNRFYEKQAEVIETIYGDIKDTIQNALQLTSIEEFGNWPTKQERLIAFFQSYEKLRDYYNKKRIFLSKDICAVLDNFSSRITKDIFRYKVFVVEGEKRGRGELDKDANMVWAETWNRISEETIPPILVTLEEQFRAIISGKPLQLPKGDA